MDHLLENYLDYSLKNQFPGSHYRPNKLVSIGRFLKTAFLNKLHLRTWPILKMPSVFSLNFNLID